MQPTKSHQHAVHTGTSEDPLERALAMIGAKADEFRTVWGDENRARALEWALAQVETARKEIATDHLTLQESKQLSGYSTDHLARLVREGKVPAYRPGGPHGRIYIRRGDLPLKPGRSHTPNADVRELASRLFRGKEGRHGQS